MIKAILFDWNGTLFDDLQESIASMNSILERRNLPQFKTTEDYHAVFTFPVSDYYNQLGFDYHRDSFENLSYEFMDEYDKRAINCQLMQGTTELLQLCHNKGIQCVLLSASKQDNLLRQVRALNAESYFDEILGIEDIFAASKVKLAQTWFQQNSYLNNEIVVVGDTMHDIEVAKALDCSCVLVSQGHQSYEKLQKSGYLVLKSLYELGKWV